MAGGNNFTLIVNDEIANPDSSSTCDVKYCFKEGSQKIPNSPDIILEDKLGTWVPFLLKGFLSKFLANEILAKQNIL